MNAIIIDDDPFFILQLKDFCQIKNISIVNSFEEPMTALEYLQNNPIDLVFLDIHLPKLNGFELMENIPNFKTIVTTVDEKSAVKAFDYNVVDFLLKPITLNRFIKAIQKVEQSLEIEKNNGQEPEFIYVNIDKRLIKITLNEIDCIEANGNYSEIILEGNIANISVHTPLKKLSEKLPKSAFMQVHRSFVINLKKIIDIQDNSFVIGKKVIPLGKSYKEELYKKLNLL